MSWPWEIKTGRPFGLRVALFVVTCLLAAVLTIAALVAGLYVAYAV